MIQEGIAVAGVVETAVSLSLWRVETAAGNGERRVVVQPIVVKPEWVERIWEILDRVTGAVLRERAANR
jgi:hypothetical protein